MIASRRKAERLREAMRMRGIDESRLARLAAPAGPDAGARTPGEIALVSMVGVLAMLRGRRNRPVTLRRLRKKNARAMRSSHSLRSPRE